MKILLPVLLLLHCSLSWSQDEFPQVKDHWLRAAPPNAMMQAAYLQLQNHTSEDKLLVGAYSPEFGMAEIHKTIEVDGLTRMQHQEQLVLPANQSLSFEPGGLHIMLMQPHRSLKVGEEVKICLIYKKGEELEVQHIFFPVLKK